MPPASTKLLLIRIGSHEIRLENFLKQTRLQKTQCREGLGGAGASICTLRPGKSVVLAHSSRSPDGQTLTEIAAMRRLGSRRSWLDNCRCHNLGS